MLALPPSDVKPPPLPSPSSGGESSIISSAEVPGLLPGVSPVEAGSSVLVACAVVMVVVGAEEEEAEEAEEEEERM